MIHWFEKNKKFSLIITILIVIEIFYFSSLSFKGGGSGSSLIPKIYHFVIFFLLGFFILITINKKSKSPSCLTAIILAILYAILDEVHQLFVPFRNFSLTDILTDSLGIFLSLIIYKIYKNKNQSN